MARHSRAVLFVLCAACACVAAAAEVALVSVLNEQAVLLSIDGGEPKMVRVGQSWSGVTVVSVDKDRATVEVGGKRRVLVRGQLAAKSTPTSGRQTVTLSADTRGHFIAEAQINGGPIRVMVDTGASVIAIPAFEAERLGIDYRKGRRQSVQTAGGANEAWAVTFTTVRIGAIELYNVEGVVIEKGLEGALLGMTFLNRVEMRRDGQLMTLIRRF